MWTRLHITGFLAVSVLIWWLVLAMSDTGVSWDHLAPFSAVVGSLVLVGLAFEHFLWRLPLLHGWFEKRPDLRGTWCVDLRSDLICEGEAQPNPAIVCFMGVVQSHSTLQMHLMTPESESWLIADRISPSPKGSGYQVIGVYLNQPQTNLRGIRTDIHFGAFILDTHGLSRGYPDTLTGEYWTDRRMKGTMTLSRRMNKVFTTFADAERAFEGMQ